jgi:hypothetical protein
VLASWDLLTRRVGAWVRKRRAETTCNVARCRRARRRRSGRGARRADATVRKTHTPERGPAASDAVPAALPNGAARRRWKSLQRRKHRGLGACAHK